MAAKDYQKALTGYQAALSLKPGESYPQGKVTEINSIKAELAAKEAQENEYKEAISKADKAMLAKDFEMALTNYQSAQKLKPGESYPSQKISEISAFKEEARKQKEIEDKYNALIATADDNLKKKQYEEARSAYKEAGTLKPSEEYPKTQIVSINQVLESLTNEKEQAYQVAISKADNYFAQQDYEMAKLQYDRAVELKPEEKYPQDKLKLTNDQIIIKKQFVQKEYDKTITDADNFFTTKIYDNAIDSYRAASVLKPDEEYPKEMTRRILKLLSERSIVQINQYPLMIVNNTEHKFEFIPVPVKDRKSNYIYFKARNASKKEYKLIVSFGKDQAKNGGVVVKVPPGDEIHDYIVRISAQYKWFSEDNNWIAFYPEGGDIEVSLMQISFSD